MLRFRHHAALAVLALACSKDASTGIALAISAEARVPAELDTLEIVATRGAADTRFARTYRMPKDATIPGSLVFVDDEDGGGDPLTITVRGRRGDGAKGRIERKARLRFAREATKLLRLRLEYACIDVPCDEQTTCVHGACVSPDVDADGLPAFDGDDDAFRPSGCFDERACVAGAQQAALSPTCAFAVPAGGAGNVFLAWAVAPDNPVVLEPGTDFTRDGAEARLSGVLCSAANKGLVAAVLVSSQCAPKAAPVCVPPASSGAAGAGGVGRMSGSSGQAGAGASGQAGSSGAGTGGAGGAGQGGTAGGAGAGQGGAGQGGTAGGAGAGQGGAGQGGTAGGAGAGQGGAGAGQGGASGGGGAGAGAGGAGKGGGGIGGAGASGAGGTSGASGTGGAGAGAGGAGTSGSSGQGGAGTSGSSGQGGAGQGGAIPPPPSPVVELAAGLERTCARLQGGDVWCWGANPNGEGVGPSTSTAAALPTPTKVGGLPPASKLTYAGSHGCILSTAKEPWCWGSNYGGELGAVGAPSVSDPVKVDAIATADDIASSAYASCALLAGSISCWGTNGGGALGTGGPDTDVALTPGPIAGGLDDFVELVGGASTIMCARRTGGEIRCWGFGETTPKVVPGLPVGIAQIAVADEGNVFFVTSSGAVLRSSADGSGSGWQAPVVVSGLPPVKRVGGTGTLCAITDADTVTCARTSDVKAGSATFTEIAGVPGVPVGVLGGPVPQNPDMGFDCAWTGEGNAACWGDDSLGQLGIGWTHFAVTPAPTGITGAIDVDAYANGTAAVVSGGAIRRIGQTRALTGDYSFTTTASPTTITVPGLTALRLGETTFAGSAYLLAGSSVSIAQAGTLLAGDVRLREGGTFTSFSDARPGSVADLGLTPSGVVLYAPGVFSTPGYRAIFGLGAPGIPNAVGVQVVPGTAGAVQVASFPESDTPSFYHLCARLAGGTVSCWGINGYGEVGNGSAAPEVYTASDVGLTGVTDVCVGSSHSCAVTGGVAHCWGRNAELQGSFGLETSNVPLAVQGLPATVADVTCGAYHTCATLQDGSLWCWGRNVEGQLGAGKRSPSEAPSQVGITGVKKVAAAGTHTCAIDGADEVRCWGSSYFGQIGNGTSGIHASATPVAWP